MDELKVIGTIAVNNAGGVKVKVIGAEVDIVREAIATIVVRANNGGNWSVSDCLVEQTAVAGTGISISNVRVDGDVVMGSFFSGSGSFAPMMMGGVAVERRGKEVWVKGKKQTDAPETPLTKIGLSIARLLGSCNNINGVEIAIHDGSVYINGKLQMDAAEEATDAAAEAAPEPPLELMPDRAVIAVPLTFRGSLHLENNGKKAITIDGWCGGDFRIDNNERGDVTVTGPVADVNDLSIAVSGKGGVVLSKAVSCLKLDAAIRERGNVTLPSITAGVLNLGSSNGGGFTVEGPVAVTTTADIILGERGSAVFSGEVSAKALTATLGGRGDLILPKIAAETVQLSSSDRGGFHVQSVSDCADISVTLGGLGNANFAQAVQCRSMQVTLTDRGGVVSGGVFADVLTIATSGPGGVSVTSGACNSGSVSSSDRGNVTLCGAFKNVRQSRTGRGQITIVG